MVSMDKAAGFPMSPNGSGGRAEHWSGERNSGVEGSCIIRVGCHREVFRQIETGHKNGLDVAVVLAFCESNPRVVVFHRVLGECVYDLDVSHVRLVARYQRCARFPGNFVREVCSNINES